MDARIILVRGIPLAWQCSYRLLVRVRVVRDGFGSPDSRAGEGAGPTYPH